MNLPFVPGSLPWRIWRQFLEQLADAPIRHEVTDVCVALSHDVATDQFCHALDLVAASAGLRISGQPPDGSGRRWLQVHHIADAHLSAPVANPVQPTPTRDSQ